MCRTASSVSGAPFKLKTTEKKLALNVLSYFVHFLVLLFVSYFSRMSSFLVIFQPSS